MWLYKMRTCGNLCEEYRRIYENSLVFKNLKLFQKLKMGKMLKNHKTNF